MGNSIPQLRVSNYRARTKKTIWRIRDTSTHSDKRLCYISDSVVFSCIPPLNKKLEIQCTTDTWQQCLKRSILEKLIPKSQLFK